MAFRYTGFADEADPSLQGQIQVLKELGWSGLETRLVDKKNFCDFSTQEFEAALESLRAQGIGIVGFGSQLANWARPITSDFQKDLEELERNLPRMRKAGSRLIRCMSYPNDPKQPWPEDRWKAEVFRRLRELARRCQDAGVILAHENCSGYGGLGPRQTLELLEAVDNPAFKLILDTGNQSLHLQDSQATWELYQATRAHIVHIHIKSARPGPDGKMATCYPDQDPMQRRVLADLKANGYDGWLSIEPHLKAAVHAGKDVNDRAEATRTFLDYGRRLMRLVESL